MPAPSRWLWGRAGLVGDHPVAVGPGAVGEDAYQNDPTTVCLYEMFRSEADLDFHHAQDYYKAWMAASRDWRDGSSYTRRVLRNVFPED